MARYKEKIGLRCLLLLAMVVTLVVVETGYALDRSEEVLHCQPLPQADDARLCFIPLVAAMPLWLLDLGGDVLQIEVDGTEPWISSVEVSPDGRFLAIDSVGEGHPLIHIYSLEKLLSDYEVAYLAGFDPYPGWISGRGWEGANLLVESNMPLHQEYERTADWPDSPSYLFRWKPGSEGLELIGEVEKEEVEEFPTIWFAEDSYTLQESEREKLDRFAEEMKLDGSPFLTVVGHTDERGRDEYNLLLGERMAYSVRDYLVAKGVDPEQLAVFSRGESAPLDPGHDAQAWARNRRVEFIWEQ